MASALLLSLLLLGSLAIGLAATDSNDSGDNAGDLQSKEDIMKFLSTVPLFSDLSEDQLSRIADIAEFKYYQANAKIEDEKPAGRHAGSFHSNTFVIYDGKVNVAQTAAHGHEHGHGHGYGHGYGYGRSADDRKLGPGDFLVQEARTNTSASTTSARAVTDVKGLSLDINALRQIVGDQIALDEAA